MDRLEVPYTFASVGAECHDGVSEKIVTEAFAPIVIWAGTSGRYEDQVALRINGNHGPGVRGTRAMRTPVLPSSRADCFGILWNGIPRPL